MANRIDPQDIDIVILAGGKGTRLRPLTAVFPKPLVPIGERPVLDILLTRLSRLGFRRVTLCTGYLEELLRAVLGDGGRFGLEIRYNHEEAPLGTAGPLALLEDLTETFMVMNGDLLTTLDFRRMLDHHVAHDADATIAVYRRDVKIDFGVIGSDGDGGFVRYHEKPEYHFDVSMGVNVLDRSVLRHIRPGENADMPDLITRTHDAGGRVHCYREDCYWLDIGRMEDYATAQEHFAENQDLFLGESA